tara:strand:- start:42476 stop:42967 length:492 start_codon:yes stop_codon:yes gene_type:complete
MLLGVVSDTHNRIKHVENIVKIFNSYNVDLVIHTGDITQAKTLEKFSLLSSSLIGVLGNNDLEEEGLQEVCLQNNFLIKEPPLIKILEGKKIAIIHDPNDLEDLLSKESNLDLVLHGHTHRYTNEDINGVRIFNPGECAGIIKGNNAIGIVDLQNLDIKRIFF